MPIFKQKKKKIQKELKNLYLEPKKNLMKKWKNLKLKTK
jgi:hypothetical protein